MQIEATISVIITHRSGPVIDDADHVRRWLCADGTARTGYYTGFTYWVCPTHANPDECGCDDTGATYAAMIVSAEW